MANLPDVTALKWRFTRAGAARLVNASPAPEGYVMGLLIVKIDGKECSLEVFDQCLTTIGETRARIVSAIT